MRSWAFFLVALGLGAIFFWALHALGNDYLFFAGYVVLQYIVLATAWNILGGYCGYVNFGTAAFFALGAYVIRSDKVSLGLFSLSYIEYLFLIMLVLSVLSLTAARLIERSRLGYGFATIRDDEMAAEATGVPTLSLKLIATVMSGGLMG